jgi:hypothetical protein
VFEIYSSKNTWENSTDEENVAVLGGKNKT